ncbi:MAG: ATP-binding protein [Vicinamibacterales bacterium]
MTLTLRARLTAVYAAAFGAVLAMGGTVTYHVLAYQLDADVTATLQSLTTGLHGYLRFREGLPTIEYDTRDGAEAAFVQEATRYFQVFDGATGQRLARSDAIRPLGLDFTAGEVETFVRTPVIRDFYTERGRIRLSNSVLRPSPGHVYLLQVGVSLAPMDRTLGRFLVLLLMALPAGVLGALAIGRLTLRVALRPLADVAAAAGTIEVGDLARRLPVRGAGDEPDAVATAFNHTLARLESSIAEMRQFSAALAHELRTPLAALRGDIEQALVDIESGRDIRTRLVSQLEEIEKLRRLIARILTLARAEGGQIPMHVTRVDLASLAASIVDQLQVMAQAGQVTLDTRSEGEAGVTGDPEWLKRLLLILVDNALAFTPPGGHITVVVTRAGARVTLAVHDTGVGITAEALPHVFNRFYRHGDSRPPRGDSAGLGLTLARWIVGQHHGRIGVTSTPGAGSVFTVSLPAASPDVNAV